jgi:uncharacterized membrane protein YidH (DUF202 family)
VNGDASNSLERTALAWQRTALAVIAGSAVLTRLTFETLGPLALVSVGVAAPLGLWSFFESRDRHRHDAGLAVRTQSRGAVAPFALMLGTTAIALVEIAALLLR